MSSSDPDIRCNRIRYGQGSLYVNLFGRIRNERSQSWLAQPNPAIVLSFSLRVYTKTTWKRVEMHIFGWLGGTNAGASTPG